MRAEGTLGVAERVVEALEEAANAQAAAESAIMNASNDIEATQSHLTQVDMLFTSVWAAQKYYFIDSDIGFE